MFKFFKISHLDFFYPTMIYSCQQKPSMKVVTSDDHVQKKASSLVHYVPGVHGGSSDRGVQLRRPAAHPELALCHPQPQRTDPQISDRHAGGDLSFCTIALLVA